MIEKRIYLASAALALENFDAHRTIEEARKHGFFGVQLYINSDYHQPGYIASLVPLLKAAGLSLIVHLPNLPSATDIAVTQELIDNLDNPLVLVHYLPLTILPPFRNTTVGWENSVNAPDISHILEVQRQVAQDQTFFVYDFARLMYTDLDTVKLQVKTFLTSTLSKLRPSQDVIHIDDKSCWEKRFRECPCPLGQGIISEFLPQVQRFVSKGGRVVLEYEDLQLAVDSYKVF